ncbi:hypothetical protein ACLOJK_025241 [Asimina triloba]
MMTGSKAVNGLVDGSTEARADRPELKPQTLLFNAHALDDCFYSRVPGPNLMQPLLSRRQVNPRYRKIWHSSNPPRTLFFDSCNNNIVKIPSQSLLLSSPSISCRNLQNFWICSSTHSNPTPAKTKQQQHREVDMESIASQEQRHFSFERIVAATQNFHPKNMLGRGGFGPVFKGKLEDGREIAVKKLSESSNQGEKEFINEARLLAGVQHRNVVNLVGYCAHAQHRLLIYEYVARESIDKLLFGP